VDEEAAVLTSYSRERHRAGADHLGEALTRLYERRQVAASVLLRAIDGYGLGEPPHAGRVLPLPEDPPVTAVTVGTRQQINAVLDEAAALTRPRLITLARALLLSGEIEPRCLQESPADATMLTVYCGHADHAYQVPAFEAVCELLYRRGVAGATVLPGVSGTVGGRPEQPRFPRATGGPLMVVAVGGGRQIAMALPELGGLFRHPLMTVATVMLCKRDGQVISRPETLATVDMTEPADMTPHVKLTVYTSEAAHSDGQPAHRAIIHQMRAAGVSGATCHRGIWGYHGDHAPHGDHFLRHSHHVPVVTTVIDTPDRIGAAFRVVDALTPDRGLVTAETVLIPQPVGISTERGV
jgi:PII-like signaling protein